MDEARQAQLAHYQNKLSHETDSWDLHEALQGGEAVVVVDGRSREAFATEHIPGSVSLPHREICAETVAALPRGRHLRVLLRRNWLQCLDQDGSQIAEAGL